MPALRAGLCEVLCLIFLAGQPRQRVGGPSATGGSLHGTETGLVLLQRERFRLDLKEDFLMTKRGG